MIPLRDHNPSGKTPYVTYGLICVNVAVFVYMLTLGSGVDAFIGRYALTPADILRGTGWLTFITSMFIHGGFLHIIGNMLFLYIFGDNLEAYLGRIKYIAFYLASGIVASAAQFLIAPHSTVPQIGASGAIAGIMGAYLALFPDAKIETLWILGFWIQRVTVSARFMLLYWIIFEFIYGFGSIGAQGGVAYFAHIGGFVFGYGLMKISARNQGRKIPPPTRYFYQ
ncbi:MAG: rhomboid family intramembrane serine protease [Patescibacteria group bacterium]